LPSSTARNNERKSNSQVLLSTIVTVAMPQNLRPKTASVNRERKESNQRKERDSS
jgi:hypothetical protein